VGECSLCDKQAIVVVNNAAACGDHVDEVMRGTLRGLAVLRGQDPDEVEAGTVEMRQQAVAHMLDHLVEGTPAEFMIWGVDE
jgi:hypothetical protein